MANSNFTTSDCGQPSGAATGLLDLDQSVVINGNSDLSSCMVGLTSGCVYGISLGEDLNHSVYQYMISVDAAGPEGVGSGQIWLSFVDESGSNYSLSIFSSTRKVHTVSFNSSAPSIVTIDWSPDVIVIEPPGLGG